MAEVVGHRRLRTAHVAIAALACVTLALGWRARALRAEVTALRVEARALERVEYLPRAGQWLPTVRAATLTGDSVTIGEVADGRNQVLLFFTAQCPYCLRAVPAWQRLHQSLASQPGGPDVIWISLSSRDSTAEYVVEHGIRGESVAFPPDSKMERVMRARTVPMTVVVDHRGKISFTRAAVLGSDAAIDSVVTAALSRPAPGISGGLVGVARISR